MESFNNSNNKNNNPRTVSVGMPPIPLPPTSQMMEGQGSHNRNINPKKRKRQHPQEISQIMQLEWTVKSLEARVGRDSVIMYCWQRQHHLFRVENDELKEKLRFYSHKIGSKQAEYVELKKVKDKLMKVYVEQQQKYKELVQYNMANAQFMGMEQPGQPTYHYVGHEIKML